MSPPCTLDHDNHDSPESQTILGKDRKTPTWVGHSLTPSLSSAAVFCTDPTPGPCCAVPSAAAVPCIPVEFQCHAGQACSHQMKCPLSITTCAIDLLGDFRQGTSLLHAPIPLLPSIFFLYLKCKGSQS